MRPVDDTNNSGWSKCCGGVSWKGSQSLHQVSSSLELHERKKKICWIHGWILQDYIKQLRLRDHLSLERRFSMETLPTLEYGIPLVRVGHGEGPFFTTSWLVPLSLSYDPKRQGRFFGLKKNPSIFQSEIMQFREASRTGKAVHGTL